MVTALLGPDVDTNVDAARLGACATSKHAGVELSCGTGF